MGINEYIEHTIREEGIKHVALKALKRGMNDERLLEITGLTKDQLNSLKQRLSFD